LIVKDAFHITTRGTAVLFEIDPVPWWEWKPHHVRVTKPSGEFFEALAQVEFARKVPPGEVMSLLFKELTIVDIPIGSRIELVALEQ
jgi:hypothetical protein